MDRFKRIELAIKKGYTCNFDNGDVYGIKGEILLTKNKAGYIIINIKTNGNRYRLYAHHFVYFMKHGFIPEQIDHINRNKSDNRINNLREVTHQQNMFNRYSKGFHLNKNTNKYEASIRLNNKKIWLGSFDNEDDAVKTYLQAKKIYHII